LQWDGIQASDEMFTALQELARDTAYVGHSTSLTRCYFRRGENAPASEGLAAVQPKRRVYKGRLAELRETYKVFEESNGMRGRPRFGAPVAPERPRELPRTNVFGERWLVLEHVDGDMPDLRACALVGKAIRDTILSGYRRIGLEQDIPEVVSGHAADGTPSREPHLAIVPLPFVGFPYADGHVMGFAVVPPGAGAILDDETFRRAMRKLALMDEQRARRVMSIRWGAATPSGGTVAIALSPTFEPATGKRSLDPRLYTQSARTFATITPIVLDRHLKERGGARENEAKAQIAASCHNIGLPRPAEIVADKHSALEGSPSAYPSGASPAWMRWRLPPSLASRQLTHAVIRFDVPVRGPVILGAGRFLGLGLCRPLDAEGR
jgi:CRISPR-associated protein Csb2